MSADSKASPHVNDEAFDAKQALDPSRALTPAVVREQIWPGAESLGFKLWAQALARLPVGWFRALQRWRHRA